jgi:tRNA (guanine37-N1)-methyltransferase
LFSAKGKKYTQKDARRLAKYDNLILICGRYEGVDERVAKYIADEEISIGDYVLTGGEIPAMILVDSISRLIPGVLGNKESTKEESHMSEGYLEFPQYTKPEVFNKWKTPKILLSGNHKEIENWRKLSSRGEASTKNKK